MKSSSVGLACVAMDPDVGDLTHPELGLGLDVIQGAQRFAGQEVVLHVFDSPLDPPLLVGG